jgi:hypothetical protein
MDRYDAILEHLKKAQSRGLDSVGSRLDAIVESLGELIQAAKTTVQNARPTQAEEVLPLADVESLVAELRSETRGPAGISLDNLRTLDSARSQSELLRALLPMLSEHVGRAVVLVIRDGVISAWSGIGFPDGEKLRGWHGGVSASANFQRLVETSKPLRVSPQSDPLLSDWLKDDVIPEEGILLPISLRGKLMGIVYMDHHGHHPWNPEAAQALNAIACWLIDTLHHRTAVPTPTLVEVEVMEAPQKSFGDDEIFQPPTGPQMAEPPPEVVIEEPSGPEIVVEETPAPTSFEPSPADEPADAELEIGVEDAIEFESVSEADFEQPEPGEEVSAVDYDFEPEPAPSEGAGAGFDPTATVKIGATDAVPSPEPPPQPPEIPTPAPKPPKAAPPAGGEGPSVIELEAPPPVRPVEPPAEPSAGVGAVHEEDARHEEARRFARLLVSEIKLYNEDEVERGRAERDIGVRLKEDIDRSREMYEKRIPADVRHGHDYFRDELVRILADGDADALGM